MTADELAEAVIEKIVIPSGFVQIPYPHANAKYAFGIKMGNDGGYIGHWTWNSADELLCGSVKHEGKDTIFDLIGRRTSLGMRSGYVSCGELELVLTAKGLI